MEKYLGTPSDKSYMENYLNGIRSLDPIEIATLPNSIHLGETEKLRSLLDVGFFWEIVSEAFSKLHQKHSLTVIPINPERYYISEPMKKSEIGGFHDPHSLGYQYWYHASFVVILRRNFNHQLRAIELARSYLHDCLHHSTFRTFRRAIRIPAVSPKVAKHRTPEVFREQYGINFRNKDGTSYSASTPRYPEAINLNLLMDGIIVIAVAEVLQSILEGIEYQGLETEVLNEIVLSPFDLPLQPTAKSFEKAVTIPTKNFLAIWGGEELPSLILQAMLSGELEDIKGYFQKKIGIESAWEKLFKQPKFCL